MKVKLWGTRGSLPTPLTPEQVENRSYGLINHFLESGYNKISDIGVFLSSLPHSKWGGFGGNTSCVQVSSNEGSQLAIDAGSGLRLLGYECLKGDLRQGRGRFDLLFTHFHWDHLMGLPFFVPIFIPGNQIHLYSVQDNLEDIIRTLFKKPFFPLDFSSLGSKIIFHKLEPRQKTRIQNFEVTPYLLDHPDPCWGFKIEADGKAYAHCVDTECIRVSRSELGQDLPLYQGIDLMVFDSQYTLLETLEKVNWGHSAATLGLDIAMREGIKKVFFVHHDPASNDDKVQEAENQAKRYYRSQLKTASRTGHFLHPVDWCFAYDGMSVEL